MSTPKIRSFQSPECKSQLTKMSLRSLQISLSSLAVDATTDPRSTFSHVSQPHQVTRYFLEPTCAISVYLLSHQTCRNQLLTSQNTEYRLQDLSSLHGPAFGLCQVAQASYTWNVPDWLLSHHHNVLKILGSSMLQAPDMVNLPRLPLKNTTIGN